MYINVGVQNCIFLKAYSYRKFTSTRHTPLVLNKELISLCGEMLTQGMGDYSHYNEYDYLKILSLQLHHYYIKLIRFYSNHNYVHDS